MMIVLIPLLLLYGFIIFVASRLSKWFALGLHAALIIILFICQHYEVGYSGGSDAAGNAMASGLLFFLYYVVMIGSSVIFLIVFPLSIMKGPKKENKKSQNKP